MKMKRILSDHKPGRWDTVFVAICALAAFFLWNHPDISETSVHTRILLDDIFGGRFFQFYEDTMAAKETIGYANAAHYHIVFYLLCALWDLPLYLLNMVIPVGDFAFLLWTKSLAVAAWLLSGILVQKLAQSLNVPDHKCVWAKYFFWLCPVAFFTVLCMGQYDSVCLVFILTALIFYVNDKFLLFVFAMGAAVVFKMFAVFLLIPLILLRKKRILHILGYTALSFWLYLPAAILFRGRDGDMSFFNDLIAQRIFVQQFPTVGGPSLLLTVLAGVYFLCWIWKPKSQQELNQYAVYLCFVILTSIFLTVQWHPQWLILLSPFLIVSTLKSSQTNVWGLLNVIYYSGFFILTAYFFTGQVESNLFNLGVLREGLGLIPAQDAMRTNTIYFNLIPYCAKLAAVAFSAPLLIGIFGKIPYRQKTLLERVGQIPDEIPLWLSVYGTFIISYGCFWLAPTIFAWVSAMGFI